MYDGHSTFLLVVPLACHFLFETSSASTVHQRKLNWRERIPNVSECAYNFTIKKNHATLQRIYTFET